MVSFACSASLSPWIYRSCYQQQAHLGSQGTRCCSRLCWVADHLEVLPENTISVQLTKTCSCRKFTLPRDKSIIPWHLKEDLRSQCCRCLQEYCQNRQGPNYKKQSLAVHVKFAPKERTYIFLNFVWLRLSLNEFGILLLIMLSTAEG